MAAPCQRRQALRITKPDFGGVSKCRGHCRPLTHPHATPVAAGHVYPCFLPQAPTRTPSHRAGGCLNVENQSLVDSPIDNSPRSQTTRLRSKIELYRTSGRERLPSNALKRNLRVDMRRDAPQWGGGIFDLPESNGSCPYVVWLCTASNLPARGVQFHARHQADPNPRKSC